MNQLHRRVDGPLTSNWDAGAPACLLFHHVTLGDSTRDWSWRARSRRHGRAEVKTKEDPEGGS